jgi:hypothetical protein
VTTIFDYTTFIDEYTVTDVRFAETRTQRAAEIVRATVEIMPATSEPGEEELEPGTVQVTVRVRGYELGRTGKRDARQSIQQNIYGSGDLDGRERYEFERDIALQSLGRHNIDPHKAFGASLKPWTEYEQDYRRALGV